MASNLKTIGLSKLDTICDSEYVKKVLKFKTKKELISFLQDEENADDLSFLQGLEQQVNDQNTHIRQEIQDYFLTIVDKLTQFREEIKKQEKIKRQEAKDRKAQEDRELKELEKQKIIEEYLAKEALKKEQELILKRNGLTPKPAVPPQKSVEEIAPKPKPKLKLELKPKPKPNLSSQEFQLELTDYFRIAQQLVKEDIFQVYTDTGDKLEVQCLMMEGEKIKMILKSE